MEEIQGRRWIVPPELSGDLKDFERHVEAAGDGPIMVIGPTGCGKSLFLQVFKKLFHEKHPGVPPDRIVTVNCSHFGGDLNMARSELFGHVNGAFTGAHREHAGIVKDAKVLILEEVGDLPEGVQAELLTFIEDHEYRRVGSTRTERREGLQIVAATNQEGNLRHCGRRNNTPPGVGALPRPSSAPSVP